VDVDSVSLLSLLAFSLFAQCALSLLAAFIAKTRWATPVIYGASALASLLAVVAAGSYLLGGDSDPLKAVLPVGLPWVQAHVRLDMLSAFFLIVVNGLGAVSSAFGMSYGHHEKEPGRVLPFYPFFIAGMSLVTLADDAFLFIVAWEMMSLASWLLVLSTHKERETPHAAYVYIVMASFGVMALILTFGLLAGVTGDYSFDGIRAHQLTPALATGVMLLTLIGAGSKAGLVPLHAWLPLAHPAAPSHVSALMSGVMTKVAIYGIIRILFDLVGPPVWWWGAFVFMIGGVTALMGVLYAVMQSDLKRLLAYSTVENVGIITIGLGLSLVFQGNGLPALAALSLVAALFHVFNHALFKSLMFMGAGAVLTATHDRQLEHMGGLIHRMPVTAFVFLIGAAAISALPPLNGFISEWLTFQAILGGMQLPAWGLKFLVPVVGAMLALAAAMAAVTFVKAYGIVFLGRPRTQAVAEAEEVSSGMLMPMVFLAALCVVIGVLPTALLTLVRPVVASLLPSTGLAPLANSNWLSLVPMDLAGSSYSGLVVLIGITILASTVVFVIHRLASNRVRRSAIWDCGFPWAGSEGQYTASSFSQPIRRVFGSVVFKAHEKIDMPWPGDNRPARIRVTVRDLIWDALYERLVHVVVAAADKVNHLQFLSIRRYLGLMFATLVLLLIFVAVMR
jgi:formate hydrogenlyase subunit 3/multisubunit Na+/H+ antiporter MnhD subunit